MTLHTLYMGLPDGRILEGLIQGDPDGTTLIFHHGSPSSAVPFPALDAAASSRGIRVVGYSRPGYGDSARHEGRAVASCADDVATIAENLGADQFVTLGWSGGGPHALACAALLPDRCVAAATIGGVAPYDAEGLDWTADMGEDNQIEYPLAASDPDGLLEWMTPQVEQLASVEPGQIVDEMRTLISAVDEASLTGELGEVLAASFRKAVANGPWGWYDDDLAFVKPWGFDLASITVPVTIWQGRHDLMVPFAHGEWLAEKIPSCRPELREEHGHISLAIGNLGEILDDLVATSNS